MYGFYLVNPHQHSAGSAAEPGKLLCWLSDDKLDHEISSQFNFPVGIFIDHRGADANLKRDQ